MGSPHLQENAISGRAITDEVADFVPNQTVRRQIHPGKRHVCEIPAAAGQCLHAIIDKQSTEILITVLDPDRRKLLEYRSRLYRPNSVSVIGKTAGTYRLQLQLADENETGGHYDLKVTNPRQATTQDETAIAAEQDIAEADRLRRLWDAPSMLQAIKRYEAAKTHWHSIDRRLEEAFAVKDIGDVYLTLSQNRMALGAYNQALALSKVIEARELEIETLNNLGAVYIDLGERKKTQEYCNASLRLSRQIGYVPGEAQSLNNLGLVSYYSREMANTFELFNRALALWKTTSDLRGQAATLTNIAYAYGDLGEIHKAINCFTESLAMWRRAGDRKGQALALTAIGFEQSTSGEMQKALETHREASDIFRPMNDRNGESLVQNGIGYVYYVLGDLQKSLYSYKQALQLHRALGARARQAMVMGHIGVIYDSLGDKRKALYYLEQKLALERQLRDPRPSAYTLKDLGTVYESLGQTRRALDYYRRALSLSRAASDPRGQAYALNNIGHVYGRSGAKREALEFFAQAMTLLRDAEDPAGEVLTLQNIARVKRDKGDLAGAREAIQAALDLAETLRGKVASVELRTSYFASTHELYKLYIDVLMQMHKQNPAGGYGALAFEMSERARARGLLDLLAEARPDIREGADPDLLRREVNLRQLLDAKTERQAKLIERKHSEEEASALRKEIADLLNEHQEIRDRIRTSSPRYAALTQPQTLSAAQAQQLLDSNTMLLEISLGEERSYLWAVTSSTLDCYELPAGAEIERAARAVLDTVNAGQSDEGRLASRPGLSTERTDSNYWQAAMKLSQMLLGPVASCMKDKRLLFVTERTLQFIPFCGLPSPGLAGSRQEPAGHTPLVVNHEVITLPSASVLATMRQETSARVPARGKIAVFADPVFDASDQRVSQSSDTPWLRSRLTPNKDTAVPLAKLIRSFRASEGKAKFPRLIATRAEADSILSCAPNARRLSAFGFDASRATAIDGELGGYQIVHFATHALFDSEHPELSAIVLSLVNKEGKHQNGFLRLNDIYNLNLPVELVVLSACNTALGKDVKGEGLVGMTRGFMYAGATRVIASLWKVDDDATAELMKLFYGKVLQENQPPAAALRAAQVEMWKRKQWKAPYYWAAFVFQGEWR